MVNKRKPTFGVSVSLKRETIEIINGFMNKTRANFSQTLNIIVEQWDEFSIELQKYQENQKRKKAELQANLEIKNLKSAKVIKDV